MDIEKLARLARLQIEKKDVPRLESQLQRAIEYFELLQSVETSEVVPLVTPVDVSQRLREDDAHKWPKISEVIHQAPASSGNLFKVPPVI